MLPAASCLLFLLCSSFASCFLSLLFCCLLLLLGLLVLLGVQAWLSVTNDGDTMLARSILSFIWISNLLYGVVKCAFLEEFPNRLHAFVYCLGLLSRSRKEVRKTDEHKTPFPKSQKQWQSRKKDTFSHELLVASHHNLHQFEVLTLFFWTILLANASLF